MKRFFMQLSLFVALGLFTVACGGNSGNTSGDAEHEHHEGHDHEGHDHGDSSKTEADGNAAVDSTSELPVDSVDINIAYYCPMKCEGEDKTYAEEGSCPVCGMELVVVE